MPPNATRTMNTKKNSANSQYMPKDSGMQESRISRWCSVQHCSTINRFRVDGMKHSIGSSPTWLYIFWLLDDDRFPARTMELLAWLLHQFGSA